MATAAFQHMKKQHRTYSKGYEYPEIVRFGTGYGAFPDSRDVVGLKYALEAYASADHNTLWFIAYLWLETRHILIFANPPQL